MVDAYAWSHDWRPGEMQGRHRDKRGGEQETWQLYNAEYLEALRAFAPIGKPKWEDMVYGTAAGQWAKGNGSAYWTTCRPYGSGTDFLLCTDSNVWPTGSDDTTIARYVSSPGRWSTNFAITFLHWAAPHDQGIPVSVALTFPCLFQDHLGATSDGWSPALFSVLDPIGYPSGYPYTIYAAPLIHVTSIYDPKWPDNDVRHPGVDGEVLDQFSSAGQKWSQEETQRGTRWKWFTLETFDIGSKQWLRIGVSGADKYWWFQNDRVRLGYDERLVAFADKHGHIDYGGLLGVNGEGHAFAFAIGALEFGAAVADYAQPTRLPRDVDRDLEHMTYGAITDVDLHGWTVHAHQRNETGPMDYNDPAARRPRIEWLPYTLDTNGNQVAGDVTKRVLVYDAWGDIPAVIGEKVTAAGETTEGAHELVSLSYSRNMNWRGASGRARFKASPSELHSTWTVNSMVKVTAGWQAGSSLPAQTQITGYITEAPRRRDAGTDLSQAVFEVAFEDFAGARLRDRKPIIDCRQAGGQKLWAWFTGMWRRVGLEGDNYVLFLCENEEHKLLEIPLQPLRSEEAFEAPDGTDFEQHISEVVEALGKRWGIDVDGCPFLADAYTGYTAGVSTIALTLDENTTTQIDRVQAIEARVDMSQRVNRLKVVGGRGQDTSASYIGETAEQRRAGDLGDFVQKVLRVDELGNAECTQIINDFVTKQAQRAQPISWESIGRPDLNPGDLVKVTVSWIGVAAGSVFRIESINSTWEADSLTGHTSAQGVLVYDAA
jgi:hypothetical protein